MKIFISWSGERSRTIAEAIRDWLGDILQNVEPWVSFSDLEKGARWNSEISAQLHQANFGLICLTPEAQSSPWLLFEAGALAKLEGSRVWTYLYNLQSEDVVSPLKQFQHTYATVEDTRKLLKTINGHLGERRLEEQRLTRLFDRHWPDLAKALNETPLSPAAQTPQVKPDSLIPELFEYVRAQSEQIQRVLDAVSRTPKQNQKYLDPDSAYESIRIVSDKRVDADLRSVFDMLKIPNPYGWGHTARETGVETTLRVSGSIHPRRLRYAREAMLQISGVKQVQLIRNVDPAEEA